MEDKIKVAVIIINFNTPSDTVECLNSLKKCTLPDRYEVRTILVDNGSSDDSLEIFQEKFAEVDLIPVATNLGFSGGNNVGIKAANQWGADWVLLLNSDTYVAPNFWKTTTKYLTKKTDKIGSALIYFAPGFEFHKERYEKNQLGKVIWYAGGKIDWDNVLGSHPGVDEVDTGQYSSAKQVDYATGAAMFIGRDVIDKIGVLNDDFFLYLEDLEYCVRASRAGYKIELWPEIKVWHKVSASSGGIGSRLNDYFITRNRLLFGFLYSPIRTKLALTRQAILLFATGTKEQKMAVADFFTHRLGRGSFFDNRK